MAKKKKETEVVNGKTNLLMQAYIDGKITLEKYISIDETQNRIEKENKIKEVLNG
jgi:hypothetical protein